MASSSDKEKAELSIVAQYDELKRKMDAILHDTIDEGELHPVSVTCRHR